MSKLRVEYARLCGEYLRAFLSNYGFECETEWVAGDAGGVAVVGDMFFGFETVRYCVDEGLTDMWELLSWYDYCVAVSGIKGVSSPNFRSWHLGCPRLDESQIRLLEEYGDSVRKAEISLSEYMERIKNDLNGA